MRMSKIPTVIPATGGPPPARNRFDIWADKCIEWTERASREDDEAEHRAVAVKADAFDRRIMKTRPRSRDEALSKVRWLRHPDMGLEAGEPEDGRHHIAIQQIYDYLAAA
jgi:hypothetical protein